MDWFPVLIATSTIDVSVEQARTWFLSLADHPERYQFHSHRGFSFTDGRFGQTGSRFQTEERFCFLRLTLRFELIDVDHRKFTFQLLKPVGAIYGHFRLGLQEGNLTRLELAVGSGQSCRRLLLRTPPIRGAVQQQIGREVAHIKQSMESLYQEDTWAS
jgi:hypothetical protein